MKDRTRAIIAIPAILVIVGSLIYGKVNDRTHDWSQAILNTLGISKVSASHHPSTRSAKLKIAGIANGGGHA